MAYRGRPLYFPLRGFATVQRPFFCFCDDFGLRRQLLAVGQPPTRALDYFCCVQRVCFGTGSRVLGQLADLMFLAAGARVGGQHADRNVVAVDDAIQRSNPTTLLTGG